jgi:ATP phosphoribosyltransferase
MTERKTLRLAIPNGSLQQGTVDLFGKAGYNMVVRERSYFPTVDDDEISCMLIRPQEQPRYVQDGIIDAGITGVDWILETGANVVEVAEMVYSKVSRRPTRWVFVVPDDSPVQSVKDLEGKRIATELTNLTRDFLEKHGVNALVEYSFGATEVKPGLLCDAIVDATETGSSIRANNLRIVDTLIESTPRLIASPEAWADPWKRQKIEDIALMLNAVMAAEGKVWLSLNTLHSDLPAVLELLPALDKPTVSSLSDPDWVEVTTIVDEDIVRVIVPKLKRAGAHGIVEYPLNKIID